MIIFGTRGITSIQQKGSFHCPACGAGALYGKKGVRRYFTLFFVPLIPLDTIADYVECERCGGTFKPEVLLWNGSVPSTGPTAALPSPLGPVASAAMRAGGPPPLPVVNQEGAATVTYQNNGLAKGSLILGIIGLLSSFLICSAILFSIPSLIMGIIGLNRAKKSKGLMGGRGAAIAGITCSSISLLATVAISVFAFNNKDGSGMKSPRVIAASKISTSSEITAYGNTPKANALAQKYATMMQLMHSVSFTSSKGGVSSMRYSVYCELHEGSCAFLACVPDYRKFEDGAKGTLDSLAWSTANEVLKSEGDLKSDAKLCVALKGLVMFGSVMTGNVEGSSPRKTGRDEKDMDAFFPSQPDRGGLPVGNGAAENDPGAQKQ